MTAASRPLAVHLRTARPAMPAPGDEAACAQLPTRVYERVFLMGDPGDLAAGKAVCIDDCQAMARCRAQGDEIEVSRKGYVSGVLGGEYPAERIARRRADQGGPPA